MKKGWLLAGAIVGCTMGASLGACGSSTTPATTGTTTHPTSGTTSATTGTTSATNTGGTGTTSGTTSMTGTGGTTTTSGTGNCSTVGTLHPPKLDAGANIYCPFSATTDGGENQYCTGGTQHCCETPEDAGVPSTCDPVATACVTGSTDWGCQDPVADCPSGQTCCAPGASIGLGTPGCGNFAHTMHNTVCVANAAACSGIIMCTNNSECPSGQTCTPFSKAGAQVGGCM